MMEFMYWCVEGFGVEEEVGVVEQHLSYQHAHQDLPGNGCESRELGCDEVGG